MKDRLLHYVLTRHGVDVGHGPPASDWMDSRRNHLLHVTLKSLELQSNQNFQWLILTDERHAEDERDHIFSQVSSSVPINVVPIRGPFVPGKTHDLATVLRDFIPSTGTMATTRLDSDDALAPTFVDSVQEVAQACDGDTQIIDFIRGVVVDHRTGMVFVRPYVRSPFQTLVEQLGTRPPQTVYSESHLALADRFPYISVPTEEPMWFVSVHGRNLANRPRGWVRHHTVVPDSLREPLGVRASSLPRKLLAQSSVFLSYASSMIVSGEIRLRIKSAMRNLRA